MVVYFKKILHRFRNEVDWRWRVVSIGGVVFFLIAVSIISSQTAFKNDVAKRGAIKDVRTLSLWLAGLNREALAHGRPELSDIDPVAGLPGVVKAVVFDTRGRVFAPLALHGQHFSEKEVLGRVVSSRRPLEFFDKDGSYEILRPVISGGNGPSAGVVGAVYLAVKAGGQSGLFYLLIPILITVLLAPVFLLWVVRETSLTVESSGRFDLLGGKMDEFANSVRLQASRSFEADWRRLIHMIDSPAVVLDGQCRLIEMNEGALERFDKGRRFIEGAHLIDLLGDDRLRQTIVDLLGGFEGREEALSRATSGASTVSVLASENRFLNYRYTIVCSGSSS